MARPGTGGDRFRSLADMRRTPRFYSYDEVLADAEALLGNGYEREGNWGLGQVCAHLSKTMERSLDGFPSAMPLPMRILARWVALGGILKHKQHQRRFPAPPYLMPPDAEEDRDGLEKLRTALSRLKDHSGDLRPHPVFGRLTPQQWLDLHLWHSEHHLSFLIPKKAQPA
jgi:hypothetical protein